MTSQSLLGFQSPQERIQSLVQGNNTSYERSGKRERGNGKRERADGKRESEQVEKEARRSEGKILQNIIDSEDSK